MCVCVCEQQDDGRMWGGREQTRLWTAAARVADGEWRLGASKPAGRGKNTHTPSHTSPLFIMYRSFMTCRSSLNALITTGTHRSCDLYSWRRTVRVCRVCVHSMYAMLWVWRLQITWWPFVLWFHTAVGCDSFPHCCDRLHFSHRWRFQIYSSSGNNWPSWSWTMTQPRPGAASSF